MSMDDLNDFEKHYNSYMNRRKADDGPVLDLEGISQGRQQFSIDDDAGSEPIVQPDQIVETLSVDDNQTMPMITVLGLSNPDLEKGIIYSELDDHGDSDAEIIPVSVEIGGNADNYSEALPEIPDVKQYEILRPAIIAEDNKDTIENLDDQESANNEIFPRKSRSRFRPYYKHVPQNQSVSNSQKDSQDFNKLASAKDDEVSLLVSDEDSYAPNNTKPTAAINPMDKVQNEFLVPAYAIHSRPENKSMNKTNRKILIVINEDILKHGNVTAHEKPMTKSTNKIPNNEADQNVRSKDKNNLTFLDNSFDFATLSRLLQEDHSPNTTPKNNQPDVDSNYLSLIQQLLTKPQDSVSGNNYSKHVSGKPDNLLHYVNPVSSSTIAPTTAAQYVMSHESPNHKYLLDNSQEAKNKLISELLDLQNIFKTKPFIDIKNPKLPDQLIQNEEDIKNLRKIPEYQTVNYGNLKPQNGIDETSSLLKYKYPGIDNDVLALNFFGGYSPFIPGGLRSAVSTGNEVENQNDESKSPFPFMPLDQPAGSRKLLMNHRRAGLVDMSRAGLDERLPKDNQNYVRKSLESVNKIDLLAALIDDAVKRYRYEEKTPKLEPVNQPKQTHKYSMNHPNNDIPPVHGNIAKFNEQQPKLTDFYRNRPESDRSAILPGSQRVYIQEPTMNSAINPLPIDAHLANQYASYLPSHSPNPLKVTAVSFSRVADDAPNSHFPEINNHQNISSLYYPSDTVKFEPVKSSAELFESPIKSHVYQYSPTMINPNPYTFEKKVSETPHNSIFSLTDFPFTLPSSGAPAEATPSQSVSYEPFAPSSSSFFSSPSSESEEIPASNDVFSVIFRDHKSEHKMIGPAYGRGVRFCRFLGVPNN